MARLLLPLLCMLKAILGSPGTAEKRRPRRKHRSKRERRTMVKSIPEVCRRNLKPRILGIDDAPFSTSPRVPGSEVHAVGIVTSLDRFEGMLYVGGIEQDGMNAGQRLAETIKESKFLEQIHAVFIDGVSMGGLNIINIEELALELNRPVIAVMRYYPNMEKMLRAIAKVPEQGEREARIRAAGPIHEVRNWVFQYRFPPVASGSDEAMVTPELVAELLDKCTPEGGQKIPECLRIAHLIGGAVKTGQSSSSA